MKKGIPFIIIFVTLILIFPGFTLSTTGEAEVPEWEVGYKWEYESSSLGFSVSAIYEVVDVTVISVNGTDYEVYDVEMSVENPFDIDSPHYYYLKSDLALARKEETSMDLNTYEKFTDVTSYCPPKKEYDFPLEVGKTWISNCTEFVDNHYWGSYNYTESYVFTIVEKETLTVEAGTFECYKIESEYGGGWQKTTVWYSPEVGNWVKMSMGAGPLGGEMELTSYSLETEDVSDLLGPIYLCLSVMIGIIVVLLIVVVLVIRKNKKPREIAPATPVYGAIPLKGESKSYYPSAAPYQAQHLHSQYPCPTCGQPLSHIQQYNRWYCHNCNRYL